MSPRPRSPRFMTLAQLSAAATPDDDPPDDRETWFAGGERSGISVENPDPAPPPAAHLVRDLLRRAAHAGPPAPHTPPADTPFAGGGHTLGSDHVHSTYVPDPATPPPPPAIRHVTFWRDGFTIQDGALMRYDAPGNEHVLAEMNAGRAPPHILNVLPGQPVELRVTKRLSDPYTPPPSRPTPPFAGQGIRIGSPIPPPTPPSTLPSTTHFQVDHSLPTTSLQIRLADGTRLVARMNLTHTIADIRNFVNAATPSPPRPYTLSTPVPLRVLADDSQTIHDAGIAGSVVVQRWIQ